MKDARIKEIEKERNNNEGETLLANAEACQTGGWATKQDGANVTPA